MQHFLVAVPKTTQISAWFTANVTGISLMSIRTSDMTQYRVESVVLSAYREWLRTPHRHRVKLEQWGIILSARAL